MTSRHNIVGILLFTLVFLLVIAAFYIVSVLLWSVVIQFGAHLAGAKWSYWHVVTGWGLFAPLVLSVINPRRFYAIADILEYRSSNAL